MLRALITIIFISLISQAHAHSDDECLASAVFYEANTEGVQGQRAIYDVIVNRVNHSGKTACQVIKQKYQFSWWPKNPIKKCTKEMKALLTKVKNHHKLLSSEIMWFFHKDIRPKWSKNMVCKQIKNHMFCRMRKGNANKERVGKASK